MLWVKALHIISVIAWFAGLFYLPRLFVYHASAKDAATRQTLQVMERKLFKIIMNPAAVSTTATGLWLIYSYAWSVYASFWWLHLKLALILALLGFHMACYLWMKDFAQEANTKSEKFFRIANEFPTIILIAVVILAVVKPF